MCITDNDCSLYQYFSSGCTEIDYSSSADLSGDFVLVKFGEETIKVHDPDKCGLVVEDWVARKTTPGLITQALKHPRSISIEQEHNFEFDYEAQIHLCKYRNRMGGQNKNIKVETNTKWLVDMNYFLPQLELILIQLRIHLFQNKFQSRAIRRAQMSR